eukprot:1159456-Pelagomonas_calceolata.AAC.4
MNCRLYLMHRIEKPAITLLDALFSPNHGGNHNCLQALRDASTSPSTSNSSNSSNTPLDSINRECSKAPPLPDRMHGFANVSCKPLLQTKGRNQPFWGTERRYSSHQSAEPLAQQTPFASSQVTQQSSQQDIQSSTPPYSPIYTATLLNLRRKVCNSEQARIFPIKAAALKGFGVFLLMDGKMVNNGSLEQLHEFGHELAQQQVVKSCNAFAPATLLT